MPGGFLTAGPLSLEAKFNKAKKNDNEIKEGLIEEMGEMELQMDDSELLLLSQGWEKNYDGSKVKDRIQAKGDNNVKYWLNRQFPEEQYVSNKRPLTDNIIFEGVETLIPLATQQNPDCVVLTAQEYRDLGETIHLALTYLADYNNLKQKLKQATRYWIHRYVGILKCSYDAKNNEIIVQAKNPKNLILDPNASINDGKYDGEFIGELMSDTASNLVKRFPKKEKEIKAICKNQMGSMLGYVQWWTDEYVFYRMGTIILAKYKNPNWNYDTEEVKDEEGNVITPFVKGKNHLSYPQMPYFFVTVFNSGEEPCDQTGLVEQVLPTQDNINKHIKQVDKNVDNINGGIAVNGQDFNKEQAAQITDARRTGKTIVTPGKPQDSVYVFPQQAIPDSIFEMVNDQRQRALQKFGVSGASNASDQEQTVRGKIIEGNNDSSRVGGGITSALENVSARVYDYWLQMIYVYYDVPHLISVVGADRASKMIEFSANDIPEKAKIVIKVQDGSLVPQDELSQFNEAMNLWENGVLDPLSLFERLKDSNPVESAKRMMSYKTNPQGYMADYLGVQPQIAAPIPQGGGGSESGAPPTSVPAMQPQPSPIQQQEKQVLSQVKLP